jgi:protoheme IX farnesyltransferase
VITPKPVGHSVAIESAKPGNAVFSRAGIYLALVKPWIIALVLVSTLGGMFVAQGTLPGGWLIVWTLLGIALATAAAASLNNAIDADIDAKMERTSRRPTAAGHVEREKALFIGLWLTIASIIVMSAGTNAIASSLTVASIFIYVVIYTYTLKRTTPLATYVGGVAGALPPVIGYAAVQPYLGIKAFILFMVLYAWQHPHFWALALKYRHDYARAGVQNLPVVAGVEETKKQIVVWSIIFLVVSLFPYFYGMVGPIYFSVASFMGVLFTALSIWFLLSKEEVAMSLFFYSIVHLSMLYCMMVVDLL